MPRQLTEEDIERGRKIAREQGWIIEETKTEPAERKPCAEGGVKREAREQRLEREKVGEGVREGKISNSERPLRVDGQRLHYRGRGRDIPHHGH